MNLLRLVRNGKSDNARIDNTPFPTRNVLGRSAELSLLHDILQHRHTAAIVGKVAAIRAQGGMGKTTVAEAYAREYRRHYRGIWFMSAESLELVASSVRALGRKFGLNRDNRTPLPEFFEEVVTAAVKLGTPWLIVFDNAADPAAMRPFLQERDGFYYLITSRYSDWTNVAQTLDVGVLPDDDAVALLSQEATFSDEGFRHLAVDALGCFPLALVVAGGYLRQTHLSSSAYEATLALHLDDVPLNDRYKNSVLRVVAQSCAALSSKAVSLLMTLAYFPPNSVSAEVISAATANTANSDFWGDVPELLRQVLCRPTTLREALAELTRFSLLVEVPAQTDPTSARVLSIHRLTQFVLREQMTERERQAFSSLVAHLMKGIVPDRKGIQYEIDLWQYYETLAPFALNLLNYERDLDKSATEEAAKICNSAAIFYRFVIGDFNSALSLIDGALRLSIRAFGREHRFTTTCMGNKADILGELGSDAEAEALFNDTIKLRQKTLGQWDKALAFTHNNFAEFLKKRGRFDEAALHFGKAVQVREENQMHGDRLTLISRSNLAEAKALIAQRDGDASKLELARADAEKALIDAEGDGSQDDRGPDLGPNALAIAVCSDRLASVLSLEGNLKAAAVAQKRALRIYLRLYGPHHPDVWEASDCLAKYLEGAGLKAHAAAIRAGDYSNLRRVPT